METYIAFLRGINVGGNKKVPMQELRDVLAKLKFKCVSTYIQSGNVVFQSSESDTKILEQKIEKAITKQFKFEVPVLVKKPSQVEDLLSACPFSEDIKPSSYFVLLYKCPLPAQILELDTVSYPNEEFKLVEDYIYLYCSTGYGRAKCSNNFFEKKLKVTATTRNYKTLIKLIEISKKTN